MGMFRVLTCAVITLCLSGCISEEKYEEMATEIATEREHSEAERIAAMVFARDNAGIKDSFRPEHIQENFDEQLTAIWAYIPTGDVVDHILAGINKHSFSSGSAEYINYSFNYQYEFTEGWMLLRITLRDEAGQLKLMGLNIQQIPDDLRVTHKFDISKATTLHIFILAILIFNPIFILFTFYHAFKLRKQMLKSKRWLFFVIVGVGAVSFNWTTGAYTIKILKIGLLGGGFVSAGPYDPWIFTVYLPLGAILFWTFKKTGKLGLKSTDAHDPINNEPTDPRL